MPIVKKKVPKFFTRYEAPVEGVRAVIRNLEKWCEENPTAYWGEAMDILNEAKGGFWDVRERENRAEHESVEVDVDQETGVFIDRWERTK